jgi:hypothetical protein
MVPGCSSVCSFWMELILARHKVADWDLFLILRGGAGNFSLHHSVQNGSGAHPASYPVSTRGCFLGVKRPGRDADHSPPSSAEVKEWVELYLHSPSTPAWRGAELRRSFIFKGTSLKDLPINYLLLSLGVYSTVFCNCYFYPCITRKVFLFHLF